MQHSQWFEGVLSEICRNEKGKLANHSVLFKGFNQPSNQ
ncbi:hypothetical protein [Klebsiella pneumoniae ISC21]|nr:hypothetical protein [Klebsiella pneumoniae ISC21]